MAAEAYAEANAAFVDEMYEEAAAGYARALEAIEAGGDSSVLPAVLYEKRAATFIKLNDFDSALDDANAAIRADNTLAVAYYRKGLACFHLDEYETAKASLEKAIEYAPAGHKQLAVFKKWLRKCDAELDSDDEDVAEAIKHTQESIDAAPAATSTSTAPATSAAAPAPATATTSSAAAPSASSSATTTPKDATVSKAAAAASSSRTMASSVRYDWYESPSKLTLDIMSKNIDAEASEVEFKPRSIEVQLAMKDGSTYLLDIDLAGRIDPNKSSVVYRRVKAEVRLVKATTGEWGQLQGVPGAEDAEAAPSTAAAAVSDTLEADDPLPTPYAAKKDWSAIERELEKEEKEDKPEGEDALRSLFQQIYKDASDDTRRAMIKSFQTSGGTVLSTNWGEVKNQDYEKNRTAPEGMEWKKWG